MKNYINKNIDTSIRWVLGVKKPRDGQKITGFNIFDKKQIIGRTSRKSWSDTKDFGAPTGYCGSIRLTSIGNVLEIWTNGKYQFIKKEIAIKLFKELLERLEEERQKPSKTKSPTTKI